MTKQITAVLIAATSIGGGLSACRSQNNSTTQMSTNTPDKAIESSAPQAVQPIIEEQIAQPAQASASASYALPKAVIYKTNIDVNNHVAVTLSPDRKTLLTFPAPTDILPTSTPLPLAQGWLLDRRGAIGPNTVFLTYTYKEYAALPQAPDIKTILASVMPQAKVTEAVRLNLNASTAFNDTAAVNKLIANGLVDAVTIIP